MAYAVPKKSYWVNKEQKDFPRQQRFGFNPLKQPLIRTLKPIASLARRYHDIHGIVWDIREISGPIIWCCTKDEIQPWMYSTATNPLERMSPTSNEFDTQIWHARINISTVQDHLQMKSAEDIYGDMFEIGGEAYAY